jgi:hypothetical protein
MRAIFKIAIYVLAFRGKYGPDSGLTEAFNRGEKREIGRGVPFTRPVSCVIHTRQLAAIPLPGEFLRFSKTRTSNLERL